MFSFIQMKEPLIDHATILLGVVDTGDEICEYLALLHQFAP